MSEKRGRGQPKFEPTQDQRSQVKLMKAVGIPEDRICKTITNPRTGTPVAPMTLARAFVAELESGATEFHALVGNFWRSDRSRLLGVLRSRLRGMPDRALGREPCRRSALCRDATRSFEKARLSSLGRVGF
jgi:hypothetical protein